ncbi:MAG: ribonuclease J [Bacilli bacterium]|nr:ribonuclease J [Erysipelotrichaceae bacterium]MDY4819530.1 ribonuclease J [Bacilli bacterium]MDY5669673.1 ribonuclease J [Bacilli bacterium]
MINSAVSIYALGGLCEVGKNTYCIETEESLIIIDAGVMFPDESLPGVDYVIPDYSHLKTARQKIKGLFITHGHEDHIGGIPFLVQTLHIPVIYAPRLAAALIRHKLQDMHIRENINIVEIDSDSVIELNEFKVSFFYVTHSIPDSYGIVVDTKHGRIVHTGDFKIDLTPVGHEIELTKIAQIGGEGVDLLLSDSTNAEIEGYTPSETNVLKAIREIFDIASGRVILSTFSSNISRIQQVIQVAVEHNRYVAIIGRSMENAVDISRKFGIIKIPDRRIIPISEIRNYKLNEVCILCTGSQGESMAALSRIANDEHKDLTIIPGDSVVFSSSAIPGNGVLIDNVINKLTRKGATVFTNSILLSVHSSGHPCKQELRLMLRLMKPKYFMPIHGEYHMLKIHSEIAQSLGMPKSNIFVLENGEMIKLENHKVSYDSSFVCEPVYIDGRDINEVSSSVLKDREILKNDGLVTVAVGIDSSKGIITVNPIVITKAFICNYKNIKEEIAELVRKKLEVLVASKTTFSQIKAVIRNVVSQYIFRRTEREPMVIPVVMDKIK